MPELQQPFPIEYKRGKPKIDQTDRVQLCAQALCLEEMLGVPVPCGAIFYGRTRRRLDVDIDPALRAETEDAARRLHDLIAAGQTPPPQPGPRCRNCSLADICMPKAAGPARSVARFLARNLSGPAQAPTEDAEP